MAVSSADETRCLPDTLHLPILESLREFGRGPRLAPFIKHDSKRSLASLEEVGAVLLSAAILRVRSQRQVRVATETFFILLDSQLGIPEGWFSNRDDFPLHSAISSRAQLATESAREQGSLPLNTEPTSELSSGYRDRFSGIARLYGESALPRLRASHFAVIGIGGVGSWTAEALARSGVGEITLIDLDEVCITNVNRQLPALDGNVGRFKVTTVAERLRLINPECSVHEQAAFFTERTGDDLLGDGYDGVIDAIDDIRQKAYLVATCRDRNQPLVVAGGAGGKRNPAAVSTDDLAFATNDRLLKLLRKKLRQFYDFPDEPSREPFGVRAVFSTENARYPWSDGSVREEPEPGSHLRLNCDTGFGTATPVTGTFGFTAAAEAIEQFLASDGS